MSKHKYKKAIEAIQHTAQMANNRYYQLDGLATAQEDAQAVKLTIMSGLMVESKQLIKDLERHIAELKSIDFTVKIIDND